MNRRFSKQRQMILDTVKSNPIHPTADFVYNTLKADHPELSLGTVYRNLNVLVDIGEIEKVVTPFNSDRYDGNKQKHYHMICEKCNEVYDMYVDYDINLDEKAEKMSNYKIKCHDIVFTGICQKCQNK